MSVVTERRYGGFAAAATTGLRTLVAGLVSGFLAIVLSIGFANLLLAGEMRVHTPVVVGMALFSTMVLNAVGALVSPIRGGISTFQEVPIVVMSSMAAAIVTNMAAMVPTETILATIVVACMVSTALAGLALFALGLFGLGGLIRFVPYPVVGGFLAGTGWLIFQGGLTVIVGAPVTGETLGVLLEGNTQLKIALALALVGVIVFLGTRSNDTVTVPLAIFAALVAYHIAIAIIGATPEQISAAGWLVPLPANGRLWPPLTAGDLHLVDWKEVGLSLVAFPGLIVVSVMALLMNATGIEFDRGRDGDLDRELRAVGLQNLAAAPTGGLMGYPAISLTILATRLGGINRGAPLVVAGLCAAALLLQDRVLGLMPTPLLGGLLAWIGGSLLAEWLVRSYRRLALGEYLIVALIFLVIAFVGFTWGILAGLAAAIVLFVIEYSRSDIVRTFVRGDAYHSNVEASEERHLALQEYGGAILIFRLQGFLFFGTADGLRRRIIAEIASTPPTPAGRFVLIDCHRVTGIDSSAVSSFARLGQIAARDGLVLVISGAGVAVRNALVRGEPPLADKPVRFAASIEEGLTWCENALLDRVAPHARSAAPAALAAILSGMTGDQASAQRLAAYFERAEFASGATVIEEGSPSNDIYILEAGRASVTMNGHGGSRVPLATLGPTAIVGEMAFARGKPRTARVQAEQETVAWRFTRADLVRLQQDAPDVAALFHQGLARILAERLARTDRLLAFLVD
jgi:SulP family sulfate permease